MGSGPSCIDYWKAEWKMDSKALRIDPKTLQRERDMNPLKAVQESKRLVKEAVRKSLDQPAEELRASFEAREQKRHSYEAERANKFMQGVKAQQARSESCTH